MKNILDRKNNRLIGMKEENISEFEDIAKTHPQTKLSYVCVCVYGILIN